MMEFTDKEKKLIDSGFPVEAVLARRSRGLGDTVAKITHATGLDKAAEAFTRITGRDCGCRRRQDRLNEMFPYEK